MTADDYKQIYEDAISSALENFNFDICDYGLLCKVRREISEAFAEVLREEIGLRFNAINNTESEVMNDDT